MIQCQTSKYYQSNVKIKRHLGQQVSLTICLFKKLLFTMENATAAGSSQSNVSRVYI